MIPRLHLITDDGILGRPTFPLVAREILDLAGTSLALHLRGPRSSGRLLHSLALELRDPARNRGSLLLVNDRVDVARALGLPGVHLGQRSLPLPSARKILGSGALLGASVHGPPEARRARDDGADYLVVGTLYPTASHPGRPGAGPGLLQEVGALTALPLLAIGGITPERVERVLRAGAHGVAVRGGIWDAADPREATRVYLKRLGAGWKSGGKGKA